MILALTILALTTGVLSIILIFRLWAVSKIDKAVEEEHQKQYRIDLEDIVAKPQPKPGESW
jgi:hypothetical protein